MVTYLVAKQKNIKEDRVWVRIQPLQFKVRIYIQHKRFFC